MMRHVSHLAALAAVWGLAACAPQGIQGPKGDPGKAGAACSDKLPGGATSVCATQVQLGKAKACPAGFADRDWDCNCTPVDASDCIAFAEWIVGSKCDDGNPCTNDTLDVGKAECVNAGKAGAACDDANPCTGNDTCSAAGACAGTVQGTTACDDGNVCTKDSCDAAAKNCVHIAQESAACDDGNLCTAEACADAVCKPGAWLDCDDKNACSFDHCDPAKGCLHNAMLGAVCDDGDPCSAADHCDVGAACTSTAATACGDGNPCTDDGCGKDGCTHAANAAGCDDGDVCTTGEVCKGGSCDVTTSIAAKCDDSNACTADACKPGQGCTYLAAAATSCEDGNKCTNGDACAGGACLPGAAATCDDGNPCTADLCDAMLGCLHPATVAACNDGDACTQDDGCQSTGKCGGKPKNCDDGNACTDDSCTDKVKGCSNVANSKPCSDGSACTSGDACSGGVCSAKKACDDGNACTLDLCDTAKGCSNLAIPEACDDGDACTADGCDKATGCTHLPGNPTACDDKNPCTTDSCKPDSGCVHAANSQQVPCHDQAANTLGVGACKSGTATCSGGKPGMCLGEVMPASETCNGTDDDCNGKTDDGDPAKICETMCLAGKCAQGGTGLWAKAFGDGTNADVIATTTDPGGNVYVTGNFFGQMDFGGGALTSAGGPKYGDIFMASFDGNGKYRWAKAFGDAQNQHVTAMATDASGDVYLTGWFEGQVDFGAGALNSAGTRDIFVASFDSNGKVRWAKRFGDAGTQESWAIATDANANVYVTGYRLGQVDFGGGALGDAHEGVFVASFDATGNYRWAKNFGSGGYPHGAGIATDAVGNVYVTGNFTAKLDFGGGVLDSVSTTNYDIFVASFDASGKYRWAKSFAGAKDQGGVGIATDVKGDVYITGYMDGQVDFGGGVLVTAGGHDMFVASFDANGNYRWAKGFGDGEYQYGAGIATDVSGSVYVAGGFYGKVNFGGGVLTSTGSSDAFVASFDSNGKYRWANGFGDDKSQSVESIATGIGGRVYVGGGFGGQVDFGTGLLTVTGSGSKAFLAAFVQ